MNIYSYEVSSWILSQAQAWLLFSWTRTELFSSLCIFGSSCLSGTSNWASYSSCSDTQGSCLLRSCTRAGGQWICCDWNAWVWALHLPWRDHGYFPLNDREQTSAVAGATQTNFFAVIDQIVLVDVLIHVATVNAHDSA